MKVIDETEYTDALRRILKSKCRGLKAVDPSLQGDKLMRFAVSRGFEIDLIKNACESYRWNVRLAQRYR